MHDESHADGRGVGGAQDRARGKYKSSWSSETGLKGREAGR